MEQLRREHLDCDRYDPAIEAECAEMEDANPCENCGSTNVEATHDRNGWWLTCLKCGHKTEYSDSWWDLYQESRVRY